MQEQLDPSSELQTALSDRYSFERALGRGGMATVYLAQDLKHHRRVAIKVLSPDLAAALGPARFLRETEIAAQLTHPHLLSLHDSGQAAGFLYYVMPYVEGGTLRDRLKREKQLTLDDALRITCDVAEGLTHAHRHGIVHRDVKPENILLQDDRAIVADFGVARAITASATTSVTSSGIVIGTATYMSPEQGFGDRELDARSDVYALGCVLYEMLAGEPPFSGPNARAVIARHAGEQVPSVRIVRPDISQDVEDVIRKALAKTPADRYASASALAQSLRACGSGRIDRPRLTRHKRAITLTAVVALLGVGAVVASKTLARGALNPRDWILVADFDGPGDDPRLADGIRDLVTQAFQQSRFVRIFDRRQLNEVMRRAGVPETTHVSADRARELALRSSVRAVLRGSLHPLDSNSYAVVLHVVRAEDGSSLATTAGTATAATMPDTVNVLVRDLRKTLGERPNVIAANRPLRDVSTPSFEAFLKYSEALDRVLMQSDIAGSNRLLHEAVGLDSGFASAWAVLGANYLNARQLDSARRAYGRALALPDRLSAADGYRVKADVAYALDHDLPTAVQWYDLYLAEVPHSGSGMSNRALYRTALGQYEQALPDLRAAVAMNPFGAELVQPILLNLAAVLVVLGRVDEARSAADSLSGPFAQYVQIMAASAESRWAAAESLSAAATKSRSTTGVFRINATTSHASALAAQGKEREADSVLHAAATAARGSTARWYERSRLLLAIASGRAVAARQDLVPQDTTPAAGMLRALWASVAGDTTAARANLTKLGRLPPQTMAVVGSAPLLVEGWIAARGGRWRDAVDLVGKTAFQGEHDPTFLDRPDSFMLRWLAATAYEQLGSPDSAAVYFDLMLRPTNMPPGHFSLRGISYEFARHHLAEARRPR